MKSMKELIEISLMNAAPLSSLQEHGVKRITTHTGFFKCGCLVFLGFFTHSYESVLYNTVTYNFPPTHKPTLHR